MCGIVAATARREVSEILLEGLRRLEYRGYDSSGMALLDASNQLHQHKRQGKVEQLEEAQKNEPLEGYTGIAHTRWATHGAPSLANAHPHCSNDRVALVHNGIIENHEALREELRQAGYLFVSETDSEVIVHLLHSLLLAGDSLLDALANTTKRLEGAYAIAAIDRDHPGEVVAAREGSPLIVGIGIGENFLASDQMALRQVTDRFIFLHEGDFVRITPLALEIFDASMSPVERKRTLISDMVEVVDRGEYNHFMMKEIFEQPKA
ncbi:MAG: glucosamine--fructose-6-phosphate aminotransferase (isomerizing), partial [Halioglobus sp.]